MVWTTEDDEKITGLLLKLDKEECHCRVRPQNKYTKSKHPTMLHKLCNSCKKLHNISRACQKIIYERYDKKYKEVIQ